MPNNFITREDLPLFNNGSRFLTGAALLKDGKRDLAGTFDLFVRELPSVRNYLVFAGLEYIIEYLINFKFTDKQLAYLKKAYGLDEQTVDYYKKFKFTGDVDAMPEGTLCFAAEPIIRITAPIIEGIMTELYTNNIIMLQTMHASKIARAVFAAKRKKFIIGASSRSHGAESAVKAVRAAEITGANFTLTLAAMQLKINKPEGGAAPHYYIMSYPDELCAFRSYAYYFGQKMFFLIDTYKSITGLKNFIIVAKEMEQRGKKMRGIALDSGDLYKLSVLARKMLDRADLNYVKIAAMSNLDEHKIKKLEDKKAPIDIYAGATAILNVTDAPKLEVVYKLSALKDKNQWIPKMKLSSKKISLPGRKQVFRIEKHGQYIGDVIGLENEKIKGKKLLVPYIKNGKLVKKLPSLEGIRKYYEREKKKFKRELFAIDKKVKYPVEISAELNKMTAQTKKQIQKQFIN